MSVRFAGHQGFIINGHLRPAVAEKATECKPSVLEGILVYLPAEAPGVRIRSDINQICLCKGGVLVLHSGKQRRQTESKSNEMQICLWAVLVTHTHIPGKRRGRGTDHDQM